MEPKVIPITSKMSGEYATSAEASEMKAKGPKKRASTAITKASNRHIVETSDLGRGRRQRR